MKPVKKRLILIGFLVLLVGVGGLVFWGQYRRETTQLYYSGTIEATTADLSFQVNGRVAQVAVDEGQSVSKDQILASLFPEELTARRDRVRAELEAAQRNLKQAQAVLALNRTVLPAEVERAEAAVSALESQLQELQSGNRPQEVDQARLAMEESRAALQKARKDKERIDTLYQRNVVAERDKDQADLKYETALKEYERARKTYELAQEGFRREVVETARAKLNEGRAALRLARGNLKRIDSLEAQVEAAGANVSASRSALELADVQLTYVDLRSPFDGVVTSRNVEPGEVVSPGREVLSIADLTEVDLKIFVDETRIGQVKPGQPVEVKTDTFPGKTYPGRVSYISPQAEFTPKIIQTHKERVKLVYLVKVAIPNPDLELKPGMPADAWLR